jgi:hypothetical protein
MTATGASRPRYRAIIRPSALAGHLEIDLAHASTQADAVRHLPELAHLTTGPDAQRQVWIPMEPLRTPQCPPEQARALVAAWLRIHLGVTDPVLELLFSDQPPTVLAVSETVGYGRTG